MKTSKSFNSVYSVLGGLFFPVLSFGYCLYKPNYKGLRTVFVLFFAFLGLSMIFDKEGADVSVYVDHFLSASTMDVSYTEYLRNVTFGGLDFYWTFVTWFVSRWSNNPHIFLGFLSTVYGFFMAANVKYLIEKVWTPNQLPLLLLLFVCVPGFLIIFHRWWTALQIFVFGLLPVLFEKRFNRFIFCLIAAFLVHFSFIYPLLIVLLALILPKRSVYPYLIVYYVLVLVSQLDLSSLSNHLAFIMPSEYMDRTSGYINAEIQEHTFFSKSCDFFLNIANLLLVSYICFKEKIRDKEARRFLIIVLMIASFAEVCDMTEWGWRYLRLSNMLFMAFYMFYYHRTGKIDGYRKMLRWCSVFFIYCLLFQIWGLTMMIGPKHFFLGNFVSLWFMGDESISLFDFIL